MRRILTDMILALFTIAAGTILLLRQPDVAWVRAALGIPMVLLLPGAAIASLADRERRLGAVEWLTLSVAASIACSMAAGMALAATIGLTTSGLLIALASITLLGLLAAHLPTGSGSSADEAPHPERWTGYLALGVVALLACTLAVTLVSVPATTAPAAGVVQLWGIADNVGGLRIGARNIDATQARYVLTIKQGNQMIAQQQVSLPVGASRLFDVQRTAILTTNAPVIATLSDESGVLAERAIAVWTTE